MHARDRPISDGPNFVRVYIDAASTYYEPRFWNVELTLLYLDKMEIRQEPLETPEDMLLFKNALSRSQSTLRQGLVKDSQHISEAKIHV